MADDVSSDQFVIIRVAGMHCHKCEQSIQRALSSKPGVREVEVDFNSGLASVLFDRDAVSVKDLMAAIESVGYHAPGFTLGQAAGPTGPTGQTAH